MIAYYMIDSGRMEEALIKVEQALFESLITRCDDYPNVRTIDGKMVDDAGSFFEYFDNLPIRDYLFDALVSWCNTANIEEQIPGFEA